MFMGLDDNILWEMSLPGVGCGHAFKIKSKQEGHYFVSSSGELYREISGSYQHLKNFTGDITFYDERTDLFTANFKNGIARMVHFKS
jgi:hypothetical protein